VSRPPLPYRTLRHDGALGYYATAAERDAAAQAWADRDGRQVIVEVWDGDLDDELNQGWGCVGTFKPQQVTVTLSIENNYPDASVHTEVQTTVPAPGDHDVLDEWASEHLMPLTGTGEHRANDPANYELTITAATMSELVGRTFGWDG
jgi:hypothetical protein